MHCYAFIALVLDSRLGFIGGLLVFHHGLESLNSCGVVAFKTISQMKVCANLAFIH
jgi:hypothetical protein